MTPIQAITPVADLVAKTGAWKGTKYLSEKLIVRVTRKAYNKSHFERNGFEFLVTIGKPAWNERLFIRQCKQAGVKFPVSKIQLKFLPKKSKS